MESREVEGYGALWIQGQDPGEGGGPGGDAHNVGPQFIICGLLMVMVPALALGGQILPLAWPPCWV